MQNNFAFAFLSVRVLVLVLLGFFALPASAEEVRKTVSHPPPVYPELAKRMHLTGAVKIEVVVGPDGEIKGSKALGGHPVLIEAALKALQGWKYESASSETKVLVEFEFHF